MEIIRQKRNEQAVQTSKKITSAILLAAGFGTRLKPLTDKTPKALIELGDKKLIDFSLEYLQKNGITNVVINLHHLGEQIIEHVGTGKRYNLNVTYSKENPILGTGGGIKQAATLINSERVIVLNSDCLTQCNLAKLATHHHTSKADASMVLKKLGTDQNLGAVELESGLIKSFGSRGEHFFTGLQIIGPQLLETLPAAGKSACLIKDGYLPMIKNGGKVSAYIYEGYWQDLGTPKRYEQAKLELAKNIAQ